MSKKIRLEIIGEPKAQPRVKAYVRGKHAGVYTPDSANNWKNQIRLEIDQIFGRKTVPSDEPFMVSIEFLMTRPKSHYRTGKNSEKLRDSAPMYPTGRVDLDNLAKAVLDAITDSQAIWKDDGQVVILYLKKRYASKAGAIIEIQKLF